MATTIQTSNATSNEARQAAQAYLDSRLQAKFAGSSTSTPFNVPIIDISSTFSASATSKAAVAAQIRSAALTSGFFQITGHNVPASASQAVLTQASRFFKSLTPEQKERLHVKHSRYLRGWEPSDYTYVNPSDWSTAAVPETKEAFNWGYEARLDPSGGDGEYTELDGASENGNVWPAEDELPGFVQGVAAYYSAVLQLARHLSALFALSLDLPENYFESMTTHPGGIARLLYYPAAKDPKPLVAEGKESEVGLGAHSDYECFTILLSSTSGGLEILSPEDRWTEVKVADGGLVVNIGDFFMRWTNGMYRSTVHRVVNRTREERYSVPFFFSINYDQTVETLPSCISEQNPSRYPPVRAGQYVLERLQATTKDG